MPKPQATQTPVLGANGTTQSTKKTEPGTKGSSATPAGKPAAGSAQAAVLATPPKPATAPAQAPPANSSGMVWVNTESGIYHKPGSRYYGKTNQGKYMTEADARKAGYDAATKN